MRSIEFTRRGWLGLAAAAACSRKRDTKELVASQTDNPPCTVVSSLPTRPNASQAFPEMVRRWSAMYADQTARDLDGQRALHARMCFPGTDCRTGTSTGNMHHLPDFVLWHRAFLFYHERILNEIGSAWGGSPLGLPYWDWSTRSPSPQAYVAGQFTFSSHLELARSTEMLGPELSPDSIVRTVAALRLMKPCDAAKDLFVENIHTAPHTCLGWDNQHDLTFAAGDPLFYGHHANLDRLATHIFQPPGGIGWPASSGISYSFIDVHGQSCCTTLDAFASMPSPYEGDQPIDTSNYKVAEVDDAPIVNDGGDSQVRMKLQFSPPLPVGRYQLVSGKGTPLGEIASIEHHGSSDFVVWLSTQNYRKARTEGVETARGHVRATIPPGAILVTKSE